MLRAAGQGGARAGRAGDAGRRTRAPSPRERAPPSGASRVLLEDDAGSSPGAPKINPQADDGAPGRWEAPWHADLDDHAHRRGAARRRARRPDRSRGRPALGAGGLRRRARRARPPRAAGHRSPPGSPEAGRRPVGFDVEVDEATRDRLALRATGPVALDVLYDLAPTGVRSEVRASVSVRSGGGLLGRVAAEATNALLGAGLLDTAVARIGRAAAAC